MIGFTVAMGNSVGCGARVSCPYAKYAELSGLNAIKFLGLEKTITLTEEHLAQIDTSHLSSLGEKAFYLKMFVFRLFPEVDRYLYFDVDWNCYNYPTPEMRSRVLDSDKLVVVRDRPHFEFVLNAAQKINIDPFRYFNAGFYVVNREAHYSFFEKCINLYNDVPKEFSDQCMMNYVAFNYDYRVLYANRMWNMLDRNTWWPGEERLFESRLKCIAFHSPYNYDQHDGLIKVDGGDVDVDQERMLSTSGLYLLGNDRVFLFSDGYTDSPFLAWAQDVFGNVYIFNAQNGDLFLQFEEVNGLFKSEGQRLIRLD